MKFNWNQTGMPATLVSRLGPRNEFAEFKTVLNDAGNHVLRAVDAEAMAQELVKSGGREIVEMVRDLTTALTNAEKELEAANRRYERLVADLARRGISIEEEPSPSPEQKASAAAAAEAVRGQDAELSAAAAADAEWEEWDRRFKALLG